MGYWSLRLRRKIIRTATANRIGQTRTEGIKSLENFGLEYSCLRNNAGSQSFTLALSCAYMYSRECAQNVKTGENMM